MRHVALPASLSDLTKTENRGGVVFLLGILCLVTIGGYASSTLPAMALSIIVLGFAFIFLMGIRFFLPTAVITLCTTVDIFVGFRAGSISLMGGSTMVITSAAWLLWLTLPKDRYGKVALFVPFLLFIVWGAISTLLWDQPAVAGAQTLFVVAGFLGLILLCTETARVPQGHYRMIGLSLSLSAWVASLLYYFRSVLEAIDPRMAVEARSYALFALLGIAWLLADGQYGNRSARLQAIIIIALVGASLSRMATAAAVLIFMLSAFNPRTIRGWLGFFGSSTVGGMVAYYALTNVPAIQRRFTEGDVSFQVGGIAINGSGRTEMWIETWQSYLESPIWGKGVGSASAFIEARFPTLGHPHNDFLRVLHDTGLIGLVLLLTGQALIILFIFRAWLIADRAKDPAAVVHWAALLGFVALNITMWTDNTITYAFVMLPFAILVGTSIGTEINRVRQQEAETALSRAVPVSAGSESR